MPDHARASRLLTAAAVLLLLVFGVYGRTLTQGFVSFDDLGYVLENPTVQAGLTARSIPYAFSFTDVSYFQPLALLSHMLDWELFGFRPGLHHLTSVVFHFLCAFLFFAVLYQYTGSFFRSLAAAALFAVHPVNVDTAAWVAERKNLLSTFFLLLTMLSYGRYVKKPGAVRFLPVFLCMLLGLLAKPVLMTLPCLLLVMDWWPLCRTRFSPRKTCAGAISSGKSGFGLLVAEKLPLFLLSAGSAALSLLSLGNFRLNVSTAHPLSYRLENALVSYVKYIGKFVWPERLAVVYPYPKEIPGSAVLVSSLVVFFLLVFAWGFRRSRPAFLAGLLWFFGVLLPMTGVVQAGLWPAMADRFAYVPYMGLFLALCWFLPDSVRDFPLRRPLLWTLALGSVAALSVLSFVQAGYWKDSFTLFSHAVAVTEQNAVAENNLGIALNEMGKQKDAIAHFRLAWAADQGYDEVAVNLGNALVRLGDCREAVPWYQRASLLRPERALTQANLAAAWHCLKDPMQALDAMARAVMLAPEEANFRQGMGILLAEQGRYAEAEAALQKALALQPGNERTAGLSARVSPLARHAETEAARLAEALAQNPDDIAARNELSLRLVQAGRLQEAKKELTEALDMDPDNPQLKQNLAAVSSMADSQEKLTELLPGTLKKAGQDGAP